MRRQIRLESRQNDAVNARRVLRPQVTLGGGHLGSVLRGGLARGGKVVEVVTRKCSTPQVEPSIVLEVLRREIVEIVKLD